MEMVEIRSIKEAYRDGGNAKAEKRMESLKFAWGLLSVYLVVLTWIILFKMQFDVSLLSHMNLRSVNFIPFAESAVVNGRIDISEILLNIAAFIPFGFYVSMICQTDTFSFKGGNFLRKVLPVFCVSLLYETLQYIFAIGASDITDLIGNTLGGIIGISIFSMFSAFLGAKAVKIFNGLAAAGTVIVLLFLGMLLLANM